MLPICLHFENQPFFRVGVAWRLSRRKKTAAPTNNLGRKGMSKDGPGDQNQRDIQEMLNFIKKCPMAISVLEV